MQERLGLATRAPNGEITQLDRIEAKLDALIKALAEEEEDEDQPLITLDGDLVGNERDQTRSLG